MQKWVYSSYTPQQNGIAERKNGPILAIARALMLQMHVPELFWAEAVLTATYLLNRIPCHVLKGKSPFEILFPTKSPFFVPPPPSSQSLRLCFFCS
jgi:hypothetical protein